MAASNWDYCPACIKRKADEEQAKEDAVLETYGTADPKEFAAALHDAQMRTNAEPDILREDWDLGITTEGKFYIKYSAKCSVCDFGYVFKHEETAHRGQSDD